MQWPDPKCRAKHNNHEPFQAWQHTKECKEGLTRKMKKLRQMPRVERQDLDALTPPERARLVGGI